MEESVLSDFNFGNLINKEFVCVKSSRETTEEKRENYRYKITMLPTIVIIDPMKGELVRFTGRKELSFLTMAITKTLNGDFSDGDPIIPVDDDFVPLRIDQVFNPVFLRKEEVYFLALNK
jgi:hypothetical protein